jgi:KTSC domain
MTMEPEKKSTAIKAHSYDPGTRKMRVTFTNNQTYEYDDVPPERYVSFTGANSMGEFHNKRIRPLHIGRKVK